MQASTFLGIELGSTRIKSVLIDQNHRPLASGIYDWENILLDGVWTYDLDDVWHGLQESCRSLTTNYAYKCGNGFGAISGIGISAMMHGYLAFDKNDNLLTPFRTWRNTTTEEAANALTNEFNFNIPQRWSIAHLYQAILNEETHVKDIAFLTTLAGYVHWKLTGEKVLGVGDASGMFPISPVHAHQAGSPESVHYTYDHTMLQKFRALTNIDLETILPTIKIAGENGGLLTSEGAKLLDPSGVLTPGIPLCPPEGDAGTGMVATNSVRERTGNVSAGTSIFAMLVLEKPLSKLYMEIDMVTTPACKPVAMVHCNNCCTDIDAWIKLFEESLAVFGVNADKNQLYETLYRKALEGDLGCGGVLTYNYYSGEPITGFESGKPLLIRNPDAKFTVPNIMRSLLYSALSTLKLGMNILDGENVKLDSLLGHGGFFKTPGVGQKLMAAALDVPITVMESAGEGGAWGIALLAAYMVQGESDSLETYLAKVFANEKGSTLQPCLQDTECFTAYMKSYVSGLKVERAAVNCE